MSIAKPFQSPLIQPHRYVGEQLTLVATTLEMIEAELRHPQELARLLGVTVKPEWPPGEYDRKAQEFLRDCLDQGGASAIGWHGWYAVRENTLELVGAGGYYGTPTAGGCVEIGYSIHADYQGRGYATELVAALVDMAFDHRCIQGIIAHAAPDNHPSISVLRKNGFHQIGGVKFDNTLRFERRREDTP